MVRRICPICDQTMKSRNYCSVCRSYVKNPRVVNSHYYLNESHPSYEESCEYHNPPQSRQQTQTGNKAAGSTVRPQQALSGQQRQRKNGPVYAPAGRIRRSSSPAASAIIFIVVIMLLLSFLTMIIPVLMFAV